MAVGGYQTRCPPSLGLEMGANIVFLPLRLTVLVGIVKAHLISGRYSHCAVTEDLHNRVTVELARRVLPHQHPGLEWGRVHRPCTRLTSYGGRANRPMDDQPPIYYTPPRHLRKDGK